MLSKLLSFTLVPLCFHLFRQEQLKIFLLIIFMKYFKKHLYKYIWNISPRPFHCGPTLFPSTQEQLERGGRMDFQCHINLPPPHQPSYFHPKKHKLTTLLFSKNIPQNLKPSNFAQNLEPSLLFSPTKNINLKPSYFHPQLRTTPSLLFSPTIPSLSDLIFLL